MSDDRYKLFTNYMKNELAITKDDIKQWTKEAVIEVAEQYIEDQFSQNSLDLRIKELINSGGWNGKDLNDKIVRQVSASLVEQLDIKVFKRDE